MNYTFCGVARGMYGICKIQNTTSLLLISLWQYQIKKLNPGLVH